MWGLILEYDNIFAVHDMDLGKMSLVKHSIRLMNNMPLKEHNRQIPPSMYQEVCDHLKEMIEMCPVWPFHSHWVSAVILVQKKDGKL